MPAARNLAMSLIWRNALTFPACICGAGIIIMLGAIASILSVPLLSTFEPLNLKNHSQSLHLQRYLHGILSRESSNFNFHSVHCLSAVIRKLQCSLSLIQTVNTPKKNTPRIWCNSASPKPPRVPATVWRRDAMQPTRKNATKCGYGSVT